MIDRRISRGKFLALAGVGDIPELGEQADKAAEGRGRVEQGSAHASGRVAIETDDIRYPFRNSWHGSGSIDYGGK